LFRKETVRSKYQGKSICWLLVTGFVFAAPVADAKVFSSRQEALTLALPNAERIESRTVTLTEEQAQRVATLAAAQVDSKLVTFYTGYRGENVIGYAFLDTHTIRTMPGTFLIALYPTGVVQRVMTVAFYEPEEYLPEERWLRQFDQKTLTPDLQLHKGIRGIAGATLSSQGVNNAVRQALAVFQVVLQGEH